MLTAGDGQLEVNWAAPSDGGSAINDYDVRYRPVFGTWTELPDSTRSTARDATIPDLNNGTTYQVQVRAGNSVGDGPWSEIATGTPVGVPAAPAAPSLTAGTRQLEVSWRAPSDNGSAIDDYDVRYRPAGGSWTELPDTAKSTARSVTISGLRNGTAYEVQVRAGNSVGDGLWSDSATGTPVGVPAAPAAPSLTAGTGQLEVSWRAPSDNGSAIDDYDVRYRPAGGSWTELPDTAKSTARSVTISGLRNGTAYEVQVRAGNSVGDGPWSDSATGTPVGVPAAPAAPSLTAGTGQLEVSWRAPSDNGSAIDDYDVRYRPAGGSWTELPDTAKSTARSVTISGLRNGTAYEVQVRAGNSVGDGPWSDSATGTPVGVPAAPAAPGLTAGTGQLEVSWRAPSDNGSAIDDYDVRYRPAGGSWTELPDTAKSTARSVTISGLRDGTIYEVQVRAGNAIGDGPWSPSTTGTPVGVPAAPEAPRLTPGDRQLEVNWTAPSDSGSPIDDYDVRFRPIGSPWFFPPEDVRGEKNAGTSRTIRQLTNGTRYEVQVRARNTLGYGPWSPGATATPGARPVPGRPGAPRLTAGDRQLEVRWSAPADNGTRIDDYDVRYQPAGGSWTELPDTGKSTARSATIRNLRNGTEYQVQVRAGSAAGDGPWSASARGTPRAAVSSGALASYLGFRVIRHELDEFQDHSAECRSQVGGDFRLADWNDIVAYYDGGGSLTAFATGLKMGVGGRDLLPGEITSGFRVSRDSRPIFSGRRHYFVERFDHNKPGHFLAHANLDNHFLSLGSWYGTGGYALCYRDDGGTGGTTVSEDRAALVDFYNGTGGPNWSRRRNWTSNRPVNEWEGVRTDSNGRVTHLDLNRNNG